MKNAFDDIAVGHGVSLLMNGRRNNYLVIDHDINCLKVVPVYLLQNENVLYDKSNNVRHRHNVLLQDCPPPFSVYHRAYAVADIENPFEIDEQIFYSNRGCVVDDYAKVSERDMYLVFHHDLTQDTKEFINKRGHEFDDIISQEKSMSDSFQL